MKPGRFLLAIFLLGCSSLFAQNKTVIDSLNKIAGSAKNDSVKAKALIQLCWQYKNVDPDKAISYGKKALKLSEEIGYQQGIANSNNNIGIAYKIKSDLPTSLKYHLKSLKQREQLNDKSGIAVSLNNIGNVYYSLKNLDAAKSYYLKSLDVRKEMNDEPGMAGNLSNIGGIYIEQENMPLAEEYYSQALVLFEKTNNEYGQSIVLNNLSNVYENMGQFDKALKYMEAARIVQEKLGDKVAVSVGYLNIGGILIKQKKYSDALDPLNKALKLCEETGDFETMWYVYFNLSQAYEGLNKPAMALKYFKLYSETKDTIFNAESSRQITEMQTKYETEKKEKEIKLLTQQKQIQALALENRKNERNFLAGLILLVILLGLLIFNRTRLKQKAILNEAKLKQEQMRVVSMIKGQEAERKRISEELHDGIGQMLSAVKLNVESLNSRVNEENKKGLSTAIQLIDDSCREIRTISHNLMPGILAKAGLIAAINEFAQTINNSGKVKVIVEHDDVPRLDPEKEINLYRIIQELVNNSLKYADPTQITVQLNNADKGITVLVEDNGTGFDKSILKESPGNGWSNIYSRLRILNGTAEIDSSPGRGTVIFIDIPFNETVLI